MTDEQFKNRPPHKMLGRGDPLEEYNDFCVRFAKQSNVAAWLLKHHRTPEIVLLHDGHDIGMSISFHIAEEGEPALLAWDLKPYEADEWAGPQTPLHPKETRLRTTHKTPFGLGGAIDGGSSFISGEQPSRRPLSRYAPDTVDIQCWCGVRTITCYWSLILRNIERTTRPGHMRIENKRIVTTLPMS